MLLDNSKEVKTKRSKDIPANRLILSNMFLWLAKKAYSENPAVKEFTLKKIMDNMICGGSVVRIDLRNILKE